MRSTTKEEDEERDGEDGEQSGDDPECLGKVLYETLADIEKRNWNIEGMHERADRSSTQDSAASGIVIQPIFHLVLTVLLNFSYGTYLLYPI